MAVDPARVQFAEQPFRFAVATHMATKDAHPMAEVLERNTILANKANAETLATDQLNLLRHERRFYRVRVPPDFPPIVPGKTVKLYHDRLFPAGKDVFVAGIASVVSAGSNYVELKVWG